MALANAQHADPSTRAILHDRISQYLGSQYLGSQYLGSQYLATAKSLLLLVFTWIIAGIKEFEAQRTNGGYLGDVLTGFCPVEVGRIAGQNDDATDRIRLHLVAVELIAQADVENDVSDRVDAVPRVSVWNTLHAGGHFDLEHVGSG